MRRPLFSVALFTAGAIAACTNDVASNPTTPPLLFGGGGANAGGHAGSAGAPANGGNAPSGGKTNSGGTSSGASSGGGPAPGGTQGAGTSSGGAGAGGKISGGSPATTGGNAGQSTGAGTSSTGGSGGAITSGGAGGAAPAGLCNTNFAVTWSGTASTVAVTGEWNDFNATGAVLTRQSDGSYAGTVALAPGLVGYKLLVDGAYQIDPSQGRRKWIGGVENSAILVHDCSLPSLVAASTATTRPSAGTGTFTAHVSYVAGTDGSPLDATAFTASLRADETIAPLATSAFTVDAAAGTVDVNLGSLADGKYEVLLSPISVSKKQGDPLRLIFWIEAKPFAWNDALIYMALTDRYRDGDPTNNSAPTPMSDPRADYQGGDLQGIAQAINEGLLDKLGVRALWLTPYQTNPPDAFLAADNFHYVTGYHGYWPIKAREVDARIGGEAGLRAVVKAAHEHGIRILQDFVMNHVHQEHEYVSEHPDWFRNTCVCGTDNCDWDSHAVTCNFAPYLPDINHTVPEATAQMTADAVWWIDNFDLDGLRIDAVKHVEEVATRNTAAMVRETFQAAGTKYFMMGETAEGWNDCADPCNDQNYDTIAKYIGPLGLDGQFDFVLYNGVPAAAFAYQTKGFLHADYWFQHNQTKWPEGSIMTPYIGSHDVARFTSIADYRGQDGAHGQGTPFNQWDNIAVAPTDSEPYRRNRIAFSWLMSLTGAPLLYYGDEYGQFGGVDPNNRLKFKPEATLTVDEATTLAYTRKLGTARQDVEAMRRGTYVSLAVTDDTWIIGRMLDQNRSAVVGVNRLTTPFATEVDVSNLGLTVGTVLHDRMGGPDATITASHTVIVTIPASGAAILAP